MKFDRRQTAAFMTLMLDQIAKGPDNMSCVLSGGNEQMGVLIIGCNEKSGTPRAIVNVLAVLMREIIKKDGTASIERDPADVTDEIKRMLDEELRSN